jgi:hypothetical protein
VVTSRFAILVTVVNGQMTFVQLLEDTYATAASCRRDDAWTVQSERGCETFQI